MRQASGNKHQKKPPGMGGFFVGRGGVKDLTITGK